MNVVLFPLPLRGAKKPPLVVCVVLWANLTFYEDILVVGTYNQINNLIHHCR